MSNCPRGPGRGRDCESGLESESECEPCSGNFRGWQRYENFPKCIGGYLNHDLPHLRKFRIAVISTMGSFVLAGMAYQRYLHYKATRDLVKKKKKATKVKPTTVGHEHLKMIPSTPLVSKVKKEFMDVEVKERAEPEVARATGESDELNKSFMTSVVKNEEENVDVTKDEEVVKDEQEIIEEIQYTPDISNVNPIKSVESEKKSDPVVKHPEPTKSERLRKVRPKINSLRVKQELPNVDLKQKSGDIEKSKEPPHTPSGEERPKMITSPVIIKDKANMKTKKPVDISQHRKEDFSKTDPSLEIKKESANKKVDLVMNTPKVKRLKIAPNPHLKDVNKKDETKVNIQQLGGAKEREKSKTANTKLITVVTEGKKGSHVKRRGWK